MNSAHSILKLLQSQPDYAGMQLPDNDRLVLIGWLTGITTEEAILRFGSVDRADAIKRGLRDRLPMMLFNRYIGYEVGE